MQHRVRSAPVLPCAMASPRTVATAVPAPLVTVNSTSGQMAARSASVRGAVQLFGQPQGGFIGLQQGRAGC